MAALAPVVHNLQQHRFIQCISIFFGLSSASASGSTRLMIQVLPQQDGHASASGSTRLMIQVLPQQDGHAALNLGLQ
jgi:redox-regulated HSP33 family molecular chaperone